MIAFSPTSSYIGRFAPSPSGPLHQGSLVAAMASFLDAKAHQGRWLLRIEDIDTPRVVPHADRHIMQQLCALGMHWDGEVVWQSQRLALYDRTFDALKARGLIYGCACTRKAILDTAVQRGLIGVDGERPYTNVCREGLPAGQVARAWRVIMPSGTLIWQDRWFGTQSQDVERSVGDMIVKRADGLYAYQFVVVVDDADQGVTHSVRGADLLASTARQIALGAYLGYTRPAYLHVPLVLDDQGRKLSKQNHAPAIEGERPLVALCKALRMLGFELPRPATSIDDFWEQAIYLWANRFKM